MDIKKKVAVIFGGQSTEHEVSLVSATSILRNIDRTKWNVVAIGITKEGEWLLYDGDLQKIATGEWVDIAKKCTNKFIAEQKYCNTIRNIFYSIGAETKESPIDVIFPMVHGNNCEDGKLQGVLELSGFPYVGPNVLSSAVCMDKVFAKIMFEKAGIPTCKYISAMRDDISKDKDFIVKKIEKELGYPCFIKPANAGSSVGVSKAYNKEELINAFIEAGKYDRKILIEEFVDGREVESAVLGNEDPQVAVLGEAITGGDFYDYDFKYNSPDSKTVIPADIDEETKSKIQAYAKKAFIALNCEVLSRVDFFVHRKTGKVLLNEINTLPGFTDISMYPKMWEKSGVPIGQLIDRLLELAMDRFKKGEIQITK